MLFQSAQRYFETLNECSVVQIMYIVRFIDYRCTFRNQASTS